jgi:hypothetical protein
MNVPSPIQTTRRVQQGVLSRFESAHKDPLAPRYSGTNGGKTCRLLDWGANCSFPTLIPLEAI